MIKDGDVETAANKVVRDAQSGTDSERDIFNAAGARGSALRWEKPFEIPKDVKLRSSETSVTDVCPTSWSRFSCQFIRLCISPSVVHHYDLASSEEFGYARCKADTRSVPEEDTHFSPGDVGEGALLVDRVYFKAVKLDSSDIFEGDIDEAILRLVLVPIPPSGLIEYDRGYVKAKARFQRSVAKTDQKQDRSGTAPNPY